MPSIFGGSSTGGTPPFFPGSGGGSSSGNGSLLNTILGIGGVAAPIIGGIIGKSGADQQANAALQASNASNALLASIYNQQRADAAPYRGVGYSALAQLMKGMGLANFGFNPVTGTVAPGVAQQAGGDGGANLGFTGGGAPIDNATLLQQIATGFQPASLPGTYVGAGSPAISGAYPMNASPSNFASEPGVLSLFGQDAANAEQAYAQANNFGMNAGVPLINRPNGGGADIVDVRDPLQFGGVGDQGVVPTSDPKLPLGTPSSGMPTFTAGAGSGTVPGGLTDGGAGTAVGSSPTNFNDFGALTHDFGLGDFMADPGYQFRVSEGLKALQRSAAAKGNLLTGATAKSLLNYNQGAAADEYNQAFNRYNVNRDSNFNKLSTLAGFGSTANSQLIPAASSYGQSAANATVGGITGSAAARASGYNDLANGITNSIQNLINMRYGGGF